MTPSAYSSCRRRFFVCPQAETYQGAGPSALKQVLKPRPELYDELLEAARTLPRVPAPPPAPTCDSDVAAGIVAGELRGQHVTLRVLSVEEDAERLFKACNGSPK